MMKMREVEWFICEKVKRHRDKGVRQMERTKVGRDGDNSVRVYRVYVLNTLQETEHTLRDDSERR